MDESNLIKFNSNRTFGVEFEINSFDKRDFLKNPLNRKLLEMPLGIYEVGDLILQKLNEKVYISSWVHNHDNLAWIVKTDSSCGIEICSPMSKIHNHSKKYSSLSATCKVCDLLSKDSRILCDERCSFHVHIEVKDCNQDVISKILKYWIKFESVFLDSVPDSRKLNKYCECIALSNLFSVEEDYSSSDVIKKLGEHKYYTVNCFHLFKGKRKTLEFRIAENTACLDNFFVKNWVKLLIHFVECAILAQDIEKYKENDYKTGLCWLDLSDLLEFLKLSDNYDISTDLKEVRNWFISRMFKNVSTQKTVNNVWSYNTRTTTINQLEELRIKWNVDFEKSLYS